MSTVQVKSEQVGSHMCGPVSASMCTCESLRIFANDMNDVVCESPCNPPFQEASQHQMVR